MRRSFLVTLLVAGALVAVEFGVETSTVAASGLLRPKAEFRIGMSTVDCVDEPQFMVDETYTSYVYVTTNGSLPTTASRRYGVTVPHGCSDNDPLMNSVAPRPKSASPAKGVSVKWDLFTIEVGMDASSHVRTVRTLFVITSGANVLGAMRVRFFKVTHFQRYTYVHAVIDSGPCPVRCSRPRT